MERLGWRSGSPSREFLFLFRAKLENPKSQLCVFSNDRKCFLDVLATPLHVGPTAMETAGAVAQHPSGNVCVKARSWGLHVGANGWWSPCSVLWHVKHWKLYLHVWLLHLDVDLTHTQQHIIDFILSCMRSFFFSAWGAKCLAIRWFAP